MRFAVVAAAILAAAPAFADEPDGVRVSSLASAEVVLTGEVEPAIRPAFELEVDGPLAIGGKARARVFTRFRLFGLPGQSAIDPTDYTTIRAGELAIGSYIPIGKLTIGEQEVWTSLDGEWGFATLTGDAAAASARYPRHYGAGLRVEERKAGAWISVLYGRHESAGVRGLGQWLIGGGVPLALTHGAIVLGGDAVLNVGPAAGQASRRDVFRLFVAVDPGQALGLLRR